MTVQLTRRHLLVASALVPLAALPVTVMATTVQWQDWPIDAQRPDEWRTGTISIARLIKRIQEDGASKYYIVDIY
jgi:hypothetical protein